MSPDIRQLHKPLVFAHIGDLHITTAKEKNYTDFLSILVQIDVECSALTDFVYLPGDIADHGQKEQYQLVASALKILNIPVHIIAGDHDMEQGSLANFYAYLNVSQLPKVLSVQGVTCIFLDVNGCGSGGPDFRLGQQQLAWFKNVLKQNQLQNIALFMHTYPDDLKDEYEKAILLQLIAAHNIALVNMGHTHYNELTIDESTIYAATRSTGQIEEGPVGYSLISIYNGIVSWRFKPLDAAFPFVMITAPADYRLMRTPEQAVSGLVNISAIVFGSHHIKDVFCQVENSEPVKMFETDYQTWRCDVFLPQTELVLITVQATDITGRPGRHEISIATPQYPVKTTKRNGSDANNIGAWVENGILGTQLGPNRNAKPIK